MSSVVMKEFEVEGKGHVPDNFSDHTCTGNIPSQFSSAIETRREHNECD